MHFRSKSHTVSVSMKWEQCLFFNLDWNLVIRCIVFKIDLVIYLSLLPRLLPRFSLLCYFVYCSHCLGKFLSPNTRIYRVITVSILQSPRKLGHSVNRLQNEYRDLSIVITLAVALVFFLYRFCVLFPLFGKFLPPNTIRYLCYCYLHSRLNNISM